MDKVLISILSQKTGNHGYCGTVNALLGNHLTLVNHHLWGVKDKTLSHKRVRMLFTWSNAHLKELDLCKARFYPNHHLVKQLFEQYHAATKSLKHKSRSFIEKSMRHAISSATVDRMSKEE